MALDNMLSNIVARILETQRVREQITKNYNITCSSYTLFTKCIILLFRAETSADFATGVRQDWWKYICSLITTV